MILLQLLNLPKSRGHLASVFPARGTEDTSGVRQRKSLRSRPRGAGDAARRCGRAGPSRGPPRRPRRPANGSCCACWQLGTPTRTSPADSAFTREQCALTWKTSTNGWTSPAAPPRSPAPSPTGLPSAHRPGEGCLSWPSLLLLPGPVFRASRGRGGATAPRTASRWHPALTRRDTSKRLSTHGWQNAQLCTASGGSASESRAYRRIFCTGTHGPVALRDCLPVRPRAQLAGFAGCRGIRLITRSGRYHVA